MFTKCWYGAGMAKNPSIKNIFRKIRKSIVLFAVLVKFIMDLKTEYMIWVWKYSLSSFIFFGGLIFWGCLKFSSLLSKTTRAPWRVSHAHAARVHFMTQTPWPKTWSYQIFFYIRWIYGTQNAKPKCKKWRSRKKFPLTQTKYCVSQVEKYLEEKRYYI